MATDSNTNADCDHRRDTNGKTLANVGERFTVTISQHESGPCGERKHERDSMDCHATRCPRRRRRERPAPVQGLHGQPIPFRRPRWTPWPIRTTGNTSDAAPIEAVNVKRSLIVLCRHPLHYADGDSALRPCRVGCRKTRESIPPEYDRTHHSPTANSGDSRHPRHSVPRIGRT